MGDLPQKTVAGPTAEQAAKIAEATYNEFLEEPERSKQIGNIPKLLDKFEGNYGTMVKGLQKKYGKASPKKKAEPEPEPEPAPEPEAAPKKKKSVIAVTRPHPYTSASASSKIGTKSSVPNSTKSKNMATRNPKSPIRFMMNAFFPASDFSRSPNQKPISR